MLSKILFNEQYDLTKISQNFRAVQTDNHIYFAKFEGELKSFIYKGKYKFNKRVFVDIGQIINDLWSPYSHSQAFITYVPMTFIRYCYRGFNQSQIIAKQIKNIPLIKTLKRVNHVQSAKLGVDERVALKNPFEFNCSTDLSAYTKCYIVDDVYTTGTTFRFASEKIKEAYPHLDCVALTFAKTPKYFNWPTPLRDLYRFCASC